MKEIRPWLVHRESIVDERGPFKIISSVRENPRNGFMLDFLRVECPDWVVTIPLTAEGDVVLVRQFRQGVNEACIEIPGGCIEEYSTDHLDDAKRELLEETGYSSEKYEYLGVLQPNPGMMPVKCYVYLAHNVKLSGSQTLDSGEDIEVMLAPLPRVLDMIHKGQIRHSLVISAMSLYLLHDRDRLRKTSR